MGFDPLTLTAVALVSGGMKMRAQRQAGKAAEAEAESRQALLARRSSDTRNSMRENSRRMREDKARAMAAVRVQQAQAGFGETGTPLAVFGEIGSRYDEQIESVTDRSLNQLSDFAAQRQMIGFAEKQNKKSRKMSLLATGISTVAGAGFGYHTGFRETGKDPFNIFK